MKYKIFCIVLILAFLLGGCENAPAATLGTEPSGTTAAPTEPQGIAAPDFTVYDEKRNPVKLSDFFGKPIVLNFWASWCPPCKAEMPELNSQYLELGDKVHFLMIDLVDGEWESMETGAAYIQQQGYEFPVFFDLTQEAAMEYQISSIPVTYFINAQGQLVTHHVGMLTGEQLEYYLRLIYGG